MVVVKHNFDNKAGPEKLIEVNTNSAPDYLISRADVAQKKAQDISADMKKVYESLSQPFKPKDDSSNSNSNDSSDSKLDSDRPRYLTSQEKYELERQHQQKQQQNLQSLPDKSDLDRMSPQEIDEAYKQFLDQVDDVHNSVEELVSGKVTDFDAWDKKQKEKNDKMVKETSIKQKILNMRERERKEKEQRDLLWGREGKGAGDDYKLFCKNCFTEYMIDNIQECTRCKHSLITSAVRKAELMAKLETYKGEKSKHQIKKDRWNRWKKSQALLGKSKVINYKTWEYWEPESDEEEGAEPVVPKGKFGCDLEEGAEPVVPKGKLRVMVKKDWGLKQVVPKDNPEFQAIEADMKKRNKARAQRHQIAMKLKDEANLLLKKGEYSKAIEVYEDGLENQKDLKPLWTNKALAEIKSYKYQDAIDSCNKALEIMEIFEDGLENNFKQSKDLAFKAFTRRAQAYRGLYQWDEAYEDLKDAIRLYPNDKECRDLLQKTKEAAKEQRYSEEIRKKREEEERKKDRFLREQMEKMKEREREKEKSKRGKNNKSKETDFTVESTQVEGTDSSTKIDETETIETSEQTVEGQTENSTSLPTSSTSDESSTSNFKKKPLKKSSPVDDVDDNSITNLSPTKKSKLEPKPSSASTASSSTSKFQAPGFKRIQVEQSSSDEDSDGSDKDDLDDIDIKYEENSLDDSIIEDSDDDKDDVIEEINTEGVEKLKEETGEAEIERKKQEKATNAEEKISEVVEKKRQQKEAQSQASTQNGEEQDENQQTKATSSSSGSSTKSSKSSKFSIADLPEREYLKLVLDLTKSKDHRIMFCSRAGNISQSKLEMMIAQLDLLSVRARKETDNDKNKDKDKNQQFSKTLSIELESSISRIIQILNIICTESDFHCELCSHAARHLWPLVAIKSQSQSSNNQNKGNGTNSKPTSKSLQYSLLQVLEEMSQRTQSALAMSEYLCRYPDKIDPLINQTLVVDSSENIVPPEVENLVMNDPQRFLDASIGGGGDQNNKSLSDQMKLLMKPANRDLVFAILCNLTLHSKRFKQIVLTPHCNIIMQSIEKKLDPLNWKTGAINLLVNLIGKEGAGTLSSTGTGTLPGDNTVNTALAKAGNPNVAVDPVFTSLAVSGESIPLMMNCLQKFSEDEFLISMFGGAGSTHSSNLLDELKEQYLGCLLNLCACSAEARRKVSSCSMEYDGGILGRKIKEMEEMQKWQGKKKPNTKNKNDKSNNLLLNNEKKTLKFGIKTLLPYLVQKSNSDSSSTKDPKLPSDWLEATPEQVARTLNILQKIALTCGHDQELWKPGSENSEVLSTVYMVLDRSFSFQSQSYGKAAVKEFGGPDKKNTNSSSTTVVSKTTTSSPPTQVTIDFDSNEAALRFLEISLRVATTFITKVKAFETLFTTLGTKTIIPNLVRIVCLLKPRTYITYDNSSNNNNNIPIEKKLQSNIRGNLALLFSHLVQMEMDSNNKALNFGLGGIVEPFIECLRKEQGLVQKNAGVCVTKLALNERYRVLVRELKGFESLQQIQTRNVRGAGI